MKSIDVTMLATVMGGKRAYQTKTCAEIGEDAARTARDLYSQLSGEKRSRVESLYRTHAVEACNEASSLGVPNTGPQ
jgi:hypothetical protein